MVPGWPRERFVHMSKGSLIRGMNCAVHKYAVHKHAVHKHAVHKHAVHKHAVHKHAVHKHAVHRHAVHKHAARCCTACITMVPTGEQSAEHMLLAYTGGVTRQDNEQRIDFLSRVRNKALEPLHWHQNHSDNGGNHNNHGQSSSSSSSSHTYLHSNIKSSGSSSSGAGDSLTIPDYDGDQFVFRADKVVFLNDVYFCAQHIHRLLAHEEANLACGFDHYQVSTAKHIPRALRKGIWGLQVCLACSHLS